MTTSPAKSFTRAGKTWAVLLFAAMAWVGTSVWAYRVAVTHGKLNVAVALNDVEQGSTVGDHVQLDAEQKAEEQVRLIAEQEAETQARLAAEAEQAAEQQAADEQTDEQTDEQADEQADEQTQLADLAIQEQEGKATAARRAQAAKLAERAAKEAKERHLRLEAQDQAATQNRLAVIEARDAAAEEARRVAESATRLAAYENLRSEELGVLAGLSARLRFQSLSDEVDRELERVLDRVFDPLFLYPEAPVLISVATNEFRGVADNNELSRDRGRSLTAYLVSRGLEQDRFTVQADSGENLPYGSHRVRVSVEEPIE